MRPNVARRLYLAVMVSLGVLVLAACGGGSETMEGKTLRLAYDGWTGTYLPTYIVKLVLEDELGYSVKVIDMETIPASFEGVSLGTVDVFVSAWFPARDSTFDKYPDLVKLGQVYGGGAKDAYEGWMVSTDFADQANLSHVSDLDTAQVSRALDSDGDGKGELIGCPGTWVCAKRHPEIMKDFNLTQLYEIDEPATETEMLEMIDSRVRRGEPALFYMYQPIGISGSDPVTDHSTWLKGTEAYLPLAFDRTIVRSDLIVNHPEVARILSAYKIPGADIGEAMGRITDEGESPKFLTELARTWIDNNRGEVAAWLASSGQ